MKRYWPILMAGALLLTLFVPDARGASASLSLEDDEFYISVDPSDDNQGYLEIQGEVSGDFERLADTLTVVLSVNITEEYDGDPTGRYWAAQASFDDEAVTPEETRLTYNQRSADFTVLISPDLYDPGSGDIIVPGGLSPLVEGKMVLTMTYTGTSEGNDVETATIFPDYYHLINLTTFTDPVEVRAGNKLNYTLRLKNAGNEPDDVVIDIPILEELEADGWTTSLSIDSVLGMQPGEEVRPVLLLEAPKEIPFDTNVDLEIIAYTLDVNPDTEEPLSSKELNIELRLIQSKVTDPITDDDDNDDDIIDDDITDTPESSPYAVVAVIAILVILALVVIILLFVKRGGGDEGDDDDMYSAPVRI
ncbi:MAG: hypothetical protein ACMUHB_01725 [Thermoplasmatota archaeon]